MKKYFFAVVLLILSPSMLFAWDHGNRHERWENQGWHHEYPRHNQWRDYYPEWHKDGHRWRHHPERVYTPPPSLPPPIAYSYPRIVPSSYRYEVVNIQYRGGGMCIEERNYYDRYNVFMHKKFKEKPCQWRR